MTEYLNEMWTNAENLAKLVANAYIANANKPRFKMNKDYFMAVLESLESANKKSIFIRKITVMLELIEDKKKIIDIVKYINNLPVEEEKVGNMRDYPENSFGFFRTTFNFLLKCEDVQKQLKENVG